MSDSEFLSGRVLKRSLPVFHGPTSPDAPVQKRLVLPQGELAQFYDASDPIRYLAYIEIREGGVRGNHYHKAKVEWVYLIAGEVLLLLEDIGSRQRESVTLRAGELAIIQTGVAHALQTVKPGHAIEFAGTRFDPTDVFRHPLS